MKFIKERDEKQEAKIRAMEAEPKKPVRKLIFTGKKIIINKRPSTPVLE